MLTTIGNRAARGALLLFLAAALAACGGESIDTNRGEAGGGTVPSDAAGDTRTEPNPEDDNGVNLPEQGDTDIGTNRSDSATGTDADDYGEDLSGEPANPSDGGTSGDDTVNPGSIDPPQGVDNSEGQGSADQVSGDDGPAGVTATREAESNTPNDGPIDGEPNYPTTTP